MYRIQERSIRRSKRDSHQSSGTDEPVENNGVPVQVVSTNTGVAVQVASANGNTGVGVQVASANGNTDVGTQVGSGGNTGVGVQVASSGNTGVGIQVATTGNTGVGVPVVSGNANTGVGVQVGGGTGNTGAGVQVVSDSGNHLIHTAMKLKTDQQECQQISISDEQASADSKPNRQTDYNKIAFDNKDSSPSCSDCFEYSTFRYDLNDGLGKVLNYAWVSH